MLADVANAEASVSEGGVKATGHLRITAPAGFGRRHVAPLVPRFRELHPDVTISLNLSDRVVDMAGEGYDCAVRVGDLPDSSLVSVRIADNRRLCVATPPICSATARRATPATCCSLTASRCRARPRRSRGWAFRMPTEGGGTEVVYLKPGGPLDCSDGQVLHDWCPRATALPGAAPGRSRPRSPQADWWRCWPTLPPRPTAFTWCFPSASTCPAGAAVDRIPQAAIRAARLLAGR